MFNKGKYYVYFIREVEGEDRHFKIGYSQRPDKRLKQLQTGHPKKLGIFGLIECKTEREARDQEKILHVSHNINKTKGEWFKWSDGAEKIMNHGQDIFKNYIRFFS